MGQKAKRRIIGLFVLILFLALSAILIKVCKSRQLTPAVEMTWGAGAGDSVGPTVGKKTMHFVVELVTRDSKNARIEFPLEQPFLAYTISGQVSYSALGSPCGDAAVIFSLTNDEDNLAIIDIRGNTKSPMLVPYYNEFKEGIQIDNMFLNVFDDMCHPTNLRMVFVFSGTPLEEKERKFSKVETDKEHPKFKTRILY